MRSLTGIIFLFYLFVTDVQAVEYPVWSEKVNTIERVVALFDEAHRIDGIMLMSAYFDKAKWQSLSADERLLYLLNIERKSRGLQPLLGVSKKVSAISQKYADMLLQIGRFSHRADGKNSWMRLQSDANIAACMNRIEYAENLAMFGSNVGYQKFYIARAVYAWMYEDAAHGNRHRKMVLYRQTKSAREYENIVIGVGVAYGATARFRYGIYIVLNYVSPCREWSERS